MQLPPVFERQFFEEIEEKTPRKMKYRIFNSEVVSVEDSLLKHIEINSEMSLRQPLQNARATKI